TRAPSCWSATTATSSTGWGPRPPPRKATGRASRMAEGTPDTVSHAGRADPANVSAPRREKVPPSREATSSRRLGYKRERALAELPGRIEALQTEIAGLHQALADPDLYRRDASSFAAKTSRLDAAQAELEAAETEWLEVEMLRGGRRR